MTAKPRVLVADDHEPTRRGIRVVLEIDDFEVCAEVADADAAVVAAQREQPDVCLLDVRMPGGGVQAARAIAAACPTTAVVMLTVSDEEDDLFDALQAGARGYLLKDMDVERLGAALRSVLDGEGALPRTLTARLMEEFRNRQTRQRLPALRRIGAELTDKEWAVLELMRSGATTAAIAERLGVSPVTVRTHVSAILRKLRVDSREAAVALLDEE